jgi:predicted flap endonuclease-1-like 5' DNA nuclease
MFRQIRKAFRRIILLELIGILVLLFWWWMNRRPQEEVATAVSSREPIVLEMPPAEAAVDDELKRIEGIGPKISNVLKAAGIRTYAQIAAMDVEELRRVVRGGGVRIAYPETWPEQAALAAQDDWEGLEALQGELKGGRRL